MKNKKIIIIGCGPAGMMAALNALSHGADVVVLEKNFTPGIKLSITGKGRCNLTTSIESIEEVLEFIPGNPHFLYSALNTFTPTDLRDFFHNLGIETIVERGRRVFPKIYNAKNISEILSKEILKKGGQILNNSKVSKIAKHKNGTFRLILENDSLITASKLIIATGGKSYPGTGSTGDGYALALSLGHKIIEPRPSLVPLVVKENWVSSLEGLTLKNVSTALCLSGKPVETLFGDMLFTSFGLSGPIILRHSRLAVNLLKDNSGDVSLKINLKPALSEKELMARLAREKETYAKKQFKNSLDTLLPQKFIPVFIEQSGISPEKKRNSLSVLEEKKIINLLQEFTFNITGFRSFREAEVTQGGVNVTEINPKTMESKIVKDLYFAGEIIDIDGFIGGFNLQAAFSTGFIAGKNAALEV